jgi:hypothetical protein
VRYNSVAFTPSMTRIKVGAGDFGRRQLRAASGCPDIINAGVFSFAATLCTAGDRPLFDVVQTMDHAPNDKAGSVRRRANVGGNAELRQIAHSPAQAASNPVASVSALR